MDKPVVKNHIMSKDGTQIAYERQGSGPAVILVGGGLDDGTENDDVCHDAPKMNGNIYRATGLKQ